MIIHDSDSESSKDRGWNAIFEKYDIDNHDFDAAPFSITANQIKIACQHFTKTGEKEVRILCKQDTRESRPATFRDKGLFLLPVKNGEYVIIKGEGYVDIPPIESSPLKYRSTFPFSLETTQVGDSEMQHLDRAYAVSLIRHFTQDDSLVLTIRGRKYTPRCPFGFYAGGFPISVRSVQTEVDGGYEGKNQVVLIEAKNAMLAIRSSGRSIIRSACGRSTQKNRYQRSSFKEHMKMNTTSGSLVLTIRKITTASAC